MKIIDLDTLGRILHAPDPLATSPMVSQALRLIAAMSERQAVVVRARWPDIDLEQTVNAKDKHHDPRC